MAHGALHLLSQLFLCFVWILWTKGSVQPPFLAITTIQPPGCARSSSTRAAVKAATTSSQDRTAWTCVLKVCGWGPQLRVKGYLETPLLGNSLRLDCQLLHDGLIWKAFLRVRGNGEEPEFCCIDFIISLLGM